MTARRRTEARVVRDPDMAVIRTELQRILAGFDRVLTFIEQREREREAQARGWIDTKPKRSRKR